MYVSTYGSRSTGAILYKQSRNCSSRHHTLGLKGWLWTFRMRNRMHTITATSVKKAVDIFLLFFFCSFSSVSLLRTCGCRLRRQGCSCVLKPCSCSYSCSCCFCGLLRLLLNYFLHTDFQISGFPNNKCDI